ncbi:ATP-grasp domain-containing protein [Actinokineospora sp. HUAS TT18]|uniref:ATP-grasp domain-containing protein n=1 Tax=Actinokineospora sp. HUAS TT18 TaxID=3447451 RepID=UPI003F521281
MSEPDVTMFWVRSERESKSPNPAHHEVDARYAAAAGANGMALRVITADDIVIGRTPTPRVRVRGDLIDPAQAFFHTKLMSWPGDRFDAWRHLSTFAALEAAGFFVTIPATHSILNNEKVLTSLQPFGSEVRRLPTVRVCTRGYGAGGARVDRDTLAAASVDFPVIVKPSSWGAGHGVFVATTIDELDTVLGFAAPADLTMLVQPWIGRDVVDCRVYCVDGEPYRALARRPLGDAVAGNVGQGGVAELTDVPADLIEPARAVARSVGLSYVCADFLSVGDGWWFSEIEVDGGTIPREQHLTEVRFGSYRTRFDAFVKGSPAAAWEFRSERRG